jgi:Tfp pilus assembly protein PilP
MGVTVGDGVEVAVSVGRGVGVADGRAVSVAETLVEMMSTLIVGTSAGILPTHEVMRQNRNMAGTMNENFFIGNPS